MELQKFILEKHHCDIAVLKCIDFRFREADQQFIQEQFGVTDFDLIAWPGAAKSVAHDETMRANIIATVKNVCCNLHSVKKLIVLNHWDCGGYGGSQAFASADAEAAAYEQDLRQAKSILENQVPGVEIVVAYSRFSGAGLQYTTL